MTSQSCAIAERTNATYHECAELVTIYGGGIEGLLDDIAAGLSRNDLAKKIGTNVRMLNRYINDTIPDSELQAATDAHYATLIAEGIEEIRNAEERIDVAKGKALVEAAVMVAQFESPKYRPIKQDLKVTRITVGGLSGFVKPVIDAEVVGDVVHDFTQEGTDARDSA